MILVTISLCMIVKNEELVLERCLASAKNIADEIIIVDTGSTDRTREIGKRYGKVYDFTWIDDFSAARNESFFRANMDYCMWLDADDVVTEENQKKLLELKMSLNPDTDVVMMKYAISEDEEGKPLFSYYRERMVKNGKGFLWEGRVHEAIVPRGKVIYSDIVIAHRKMVAGDKKRNLRIYETMLQEGEVLKGRNLFYYGRELMAHGRYQDAVSVMEEFLDGEGWVENQIEACLNLAFCFGALGQETERAKALLRSFLYDSPRGEACFEIGQYFQRQKKWQQAVFWYKTALEGNSRTESGGFVRSDYYGYLPEINLCVCYDQMGEREKAYEYHLRAKKRKPESKEVKWNEEYFRNFRDEPNGQEGHRI